MNGTTTRSPIFSLPFSGLLNHLAHGLVAKHITAFHFAE
jgi:hypothetical protein